MLTRPRRTREYTGPTPHSVAIQVSYCRNEYISYSAKKIGSKFDQNFFR